MKFWWVKNVIDLFEMLIDVWVWVYDVYKNVLLILLYKNYVLSKMLEVL